MIAWEYTIDVLNIEQDVRQIERRCFLIGWVWGNVGNLVL